MTEQTTPVAVRLPQVWVGQISLLNYTLSDFIKEAVEEKLNKSSYETISKKIKEYKESIEKLEQQKEALKQKEKQFKEIPEKELKWLYETNDLLKKQPGYFEGRYSQYYNLFPKTYRVSKQDFKKLLNEAENQMMEKQTFNNLEKNKKN